MKKQLILIIAGAFAPCAAIDALAASGMISQIQSRNLPSGGRFDADREAFIDRSEARIVASGTVLDFATADAGADGRRSGYELRMAQANPSYPGGRLDRADRGLHGATGAAGPNGSGGFWSTSPQTSPAPRDATSPADATPPLDARDDPTRPQDATPANGAHYLDPRFSRPEEDYSRIRDAAGRVGPADPRQFDPRAVDPLVPGTARSDAPKKTIVAPPVTSPELSGGGGVSGGGVSR